MEKYFLLLLLLPSPLAWGQHPPHLDWRQQKAAFKNAKVDPTFYPASKSLLEPFLINEAEFLFKLEELSGAREVLIAGRPTLITERGTPTGRTAAIKYLTQEYQNLGYKVFTQSYPTGANPRGQNLIAERTGQGSLGQTPKTLMISSHYDSVFNAGANDDGSGTIAALLIAKALKDIPLKHTLRFVAFDNEEQGTVGSRAYVAGLNAASLLGDIHLEMMAFHSNKDGRFHVIDCDRADSTFLTRAIMSAIETHSIPLTRVKTCTRASDHASFWSKNIPAIVLSENFFGGDGDPCYHKACDQVDSRLDFRYASQIAAATASAVAELIR